jgi:hypothetical protein
VRRGDADLVLGSAWAYAFARREVEWRGNRLRVGAGSRVERPVETAHALEEERNVARA